MTAFEWDLRKASSNFRKHGIRFADSVGALEDVRAIPLRDEAYREERWVSIGTDGLARILTVVYTWRGSAIWIISARLATARECKEYLEVA